MRVWNARDGHCAREFSVRSALSLSSSTHFHSHSSSSHSDQFYSDLLSSISRSSLSVISLAVLSSSYLASLSVSSVCDSHTILNIWNLSDHSGVCESSHVFEAGRRMVQHTRLVSLPGTCQVCVMHACAPCWIMEISGSSTPSSSNHSLKSSVSLRVLEGVDFDYAMSAVGLPGSVLVTRHTKHVTAYSTVTCDVLWQVRLWGLMSPNGGLMTGLTCGLVGHFEMDCPGGLKVRDGRNGECVVCVDSVKREPLAVVECVM